MALQKVGEKAVAAIKEHDAAFIKPKPKKKVLNEEEYTEGVEKIIERDFFPDIPKLEAQKEYFEALEQNDTQKLREIHIKYSIRRGTTPYTRTPGVADTPSTFDTPVDNVKSTPAEPKERSTESPTGGDSHTEDPKKSQNPEVKEKNLSLDQYLAGTTSEDNASFSDIMRQNEEQHRLKHAWLYENETTRRQESEAVLALPSVEEQEAITGNPTRLQSWKYETKNAVMYVPDGVDFSSKEKIKDQKKRPREILHKNTRFKENPFDESRSKEQVQQAASSQAIANFGKIGHDGKEMVPAESPKVGGYGFVGTPSPAPGIDASPLMTWGEIEGTPFLLEGSQTPITQTPGPVFKIPGIPKRDQIAMDLAEAASKAHRAKKEEALKRVSKLRTPSPRFSNSPRTEKLAHLSPAAQRLAGKKLGIRTHTDKSLKASYTPSPRTTPGRNKTPLLKTPTGKTPTTRTPNVAPKNNTPKQETPKRDISSLTDNLLQLPKRQKAQDFF